MLSLFSNLLRLSSDKVNTAAFLFSLFLFLLLLSLLDHAVSVVAVILAFFFFSYQFKSLF